HALSRTAVRLLHPGNDDHRAVPARPRSRPRRGDDPRGDLRADLPLHRLHHHRPVGPVGRRTLLEGATHGRVVMTAVEPDTRPEEQDNDRKPCGPGRMLRKEDPRFVRGRGNYVDDVRLPGMLHLAVLRSPVAHARINGIDTSAALAHPKVRAVITGADLAEKGLAWMPTL